MVQETDNRVLNTDELDFLFEQLLREEDDAIPLNYNVSASVEGSAFFSKLDGANELQLAANYGNHRFIFPMQIETGDFSNLKMILKSPGIFEIGNKLRSWRLTANNKKIYLMNKIGDNLPFQIKNVSASGIAFVIGEHMQAKFPTVLNNVFLHIPNHKNVLISRLQISRVEKDTVAYSLAATTDETTLTSLYDYLFECHAHLYSEAHIK